MKLQLKTVFLIAITLITGGVVLVGYFIDVPILTTLRGYLLRWAVVLAAVGLLVGLLNLLSVHANKITGHQTGAFNSLVLILFFLITLVAGLVFGPTNSWSMWIYNSILLPVETSLLAILAVILLYTATRLLYHRLNWYSVIFLLTVLVVLIGSVTVLPVKFMGVSEFRNWITQTLAVGGARGLLIGIALGTIATGLRLLMGADRPYEG
jgi:hypothetical protein